MHLRFPCLTILRLSRGIPWEFIIQPSANVCQCTLDHFVYVSLAERSLGAFTLQCLNFPMGEASFAKPNSRGKLRMPSQPAINAITACHQCHPSLPSMVLCDCLGVTASSFFMKCRVMKIGEAWVNNSNVVRQGLFSAVVLEGLFSAVVLDGLFSAVILECVISAVVQECLLFRGN